MSLFNTMLKEGESLVKNPVALDFDFQPKVILFREAEQKQIIACIRPLFQKVNGRNLFIYGKPGIGKTVAAKHVLDAIDDEDVSGLEEVTPAYVNCWQKNTSYKVAVELCEQLGYKFTQNKKTEELFKIIANIANKSSAAFVFDEVDKLEDFDFLYTLMESIYRRSIILITNHKEWLLNLDQRIKSRLLPDIVEFSPYDARETRGILDDRRKKAFSDGIWSKEGFDVIAKKAYEMQDIRSGLHLLKEAAFHAESDGSRKISMSHVEKALSKLDEMSVKNSLELEDETRFILNIVKNNTGEKIGDLFRKYQEEGGNSSYKTFQRKIQKLADNKFVNVRKVTGGADGSTTIVNHLRTKKLTEY